MKRLVFFSMFLGASLALANGRADCARNCQTTAKNFEKQCKETAAGDPDSKTGCDMVLKKLEQTCQQACASGQKPKKPTNTNSF
ncbi:MAG: hypothetical protein ABTQ32_06220 [Myxococcaceae bacterium]